MFSSVLDGLKRGDSSGKYEDRLAAPSKGLEPPNFHAKEFLMKLALFHSSNSMKVVKN